MWLQRLEDEKVFNQKVSDKVKKAEIRDLLQINSFVVL